MPLVPTKIVRRNKNRAYPETCPAMGHQVRVSRTWVKERFLFAARMPVDFYAAEKRRTLVDLHLYAVLLMA